MEDERAGERMKSERCALYSLKRVVSFYTPLARQEESESQEETIR